ncbi:MAG: hypothetical protein Q8M34_06575, partial [Thermodesulfovibrionales bacterium]|nr:hypothetical protein [Thermodesulfovibrionales bacterium]
MKKFIILIIVVAIIAVGIGAFFVFQKPAFSEPKMPIAKFGKCGDGICDEKEKNNPKLCPKDCQIKSQPSQKPQPISSEQPTNISNSSKPSSSPGSNIVSSTNKFTDFITGFKLDNTRSVREISRIHFELAKELKLDYILVPVKFHRGSDVNKIDWSAGLDYYYIAELSKQYGVKILPAFYKLGGKDDKNYTKYADFV